MGVSLACLLGSVPAAHGADAPLQVLQQFVQQTRHATGRFEQQLDGSSGRAPERSTGHFAFERPGRFRWVYEAPYPQELVSDGTRIWSWDADLNQARAYGITGVPFFVINEKYAISGAQPESVFAEALGKAWAESSPTR